MPGEAGDEKQLDNCYEAIASFAHDQKAIEDAQMAGGVLAGATVVGINAPAIAAGAVASPIGGVAAAAATGKEAYDAYHEYGAEVGEKIVMPLEAVAVFAECAPPSSLAEQIGNSLSNVLDSVGNSVFDAVESVTDHFSAPPNPPTPPIESGVDPSNEAPSVTLFDNPTIAANTVLDSSPSYENYSANEVTASASSSPEVTHESDSAPAWGAAISSWASNDTSHEAAPTHDSGSSSDSGQGSSDSA